MWKGKFNIKNDRQLFSGVRVVLDIRKEKGCIRGDKFNQRKRGSFFDFEFWFIELQGGFDFL